MNSKSYKKANVFILVVEDSVTQAAEVQYFLEENDYKVEVLHDGKEALEWLLAAEELPDVIVSDIVMPHLDCYNLCKSIRSDEKLKSIPVILLTSLSEPHDIIKSIEAGANKFLTKPFNHKRLPEVIDELYINTQRRSVERMEMGIRLIFGGNDFLITADKVQILDLLLSSYEDSYYKNVQLQESRSALESLNADLERKVQERTKELSVQEERFRSLTEHTPDLILRIDKNMNFVYANRAVEELFDISREELIGQPTSYLAKIDEKYPCSANVSEVLKSKKTLRKELEINTPHGVRWLDSALVPEFDSSGEVEYVLKVSRDVTEQKLTQSQLKEKDKILMIQSRQAAMGDMIAMIAHQWRQPLTVISMEENNLMASLELEEELTKELLLKHAKSVSEQTQQLSATIEDFRNFFKPTQEKETLTVGEVVEKTMQLIKTSLTNNNIEVDFQNESETKILTYPNQLLQVFLNVINNAKDALKENNVANAKISVTTYDKDGFVITSVCDNGGGIPKEIMDRLGEPYFSTKKLNGTGLGLYISKTILVEHLGGSVSWQNKGDGACFTISLKKTLVQ